MSNPTPPEVTAPAGHEILPDSFAREHENHPLLAELLARDKQAEHSPWITVIRKGSMLNVSAYHFAALIGTIAAVLTPAPAGFRNVLPGWLAGLETKPKGLMWAYVEGKYWDECTLCWPFKIGREVPGLAYAVPLSQKGGDEPSLLNAASAEATTQSGVNAPVASNAAPNARPWLPIAEYDREKHGEWIEGKRLVFRAEPWEISWDKERAWWKNRAGNIVGEVTHFRLPAPSVAPEGTPRVEALIEAVARYGVTCSEAQNLAPASELSAAFKDIAKMETELASVTREREEAQKHWNNNEGQLGAERGLSRKLRAEIRVLWQRLRDANRGAERWVGISYERCKEINQLRERVQELEQGYVQIQAERDRIRDEKWGGIAKFETELLAAQTRAAVAERERDEAQSCWKCFHCGEVFTDESCAKTHFGRDEQSQSACVIKAGAEGSLVQALRDSEAECANAWAIIHNESSEAEKALMSAHARHAQQLAAAENLGYERGIKDYNQLEAQRDDLKRRLGEGPARIQELERERDELRKAVASGDYCRVSSTYWKEMLTTRDLALRELAELKGEKI